MQKHAMALGYFFLSVFCIFTHTQLLLTPEFRLLLLQAAIIAALAGLGFLISACVVQLKACVVLILKACVVLIKGAKKWCDLRKMMEFIRLARQLPEHPSTPRDDGPT